MTFHRQKHIDFVRNLDLASTKNTYEYWLSEHLRMNGLYWGVTAISMMKSLDALDIDSVQEFVLLCFDKKSGGFGAFPNHDGHLLSTLSAVQVLAAYGRLEVLSGIKHKIVAFVLHLQKKDGSFAGDAFGEVDTRFVYVAVSCLSILGELSQEIAENASNFILQCYNFDGGFGRVPGAESHAAQVFVCLATLAIAKKLDKLDESQLNRCATWLSERQVLPSGGLNGRPEKLPDVCYSWWVLSGLAILEKLHWISAEHLEEFILLCQDEQGGFSDRPDNQVDVFHTCFGITGLSLLNAEKYDLKEVDPVYCMDVEVTKKWRK